MTVYLGNFKSKHYYTLISAQCEICSADAPEVRTTDGQFSDVVRRQAMQLAASVGWLHTSLPYGEKSTKEIVICPTCVTHIHKASNLQGKTQ